MLENWSHFAWEGSILVSSLLFFLFFLFLNILFIDRLRYINVLIFDHIFNFIVNSFRFNIIFNVYSIS